MNQAKGARYPVSPIGYTVKKFREKNFSGYGGKKELATLLGVHPTMVDKWENGSSSPSHANRKKLADAFSLTLKEFMDEVRQAPGNPLPPPNIEGGDIGRKAIRIDRMVSVGVGAADETAGARPGAMYEDTDEQLEEVAPPGLVRIVKIKGDSMSPVVVDGQFAMIGPEILSGRVGDGDIVVVRVAMEPGATGRGQEAEDARWEGVYCKRVYDGGDTWIFKSISSRGSSPFSVFKGFCRLWPMIGTWFAGNGKVPRED